MKTKQKNADPKGHRKLNDPPIIDTQQTNFGDTSLTSAHINQGRAYRFHPVFNEDDVLVSCLMNIGFMVETKRYTRMSFVTIFREGQTFKTTNFPQIA